MRIFKKWVRIRYIRPTIAKKNWSLYRRFFLRKKKLYFISRLRYIHNNIRIFKKYYRNEFILKTNKFIQNLYNYCFKKSFSKVYLFFHKLNFRLPTVLVNTHFILNRIESTPMIKKGYISVNNKVIRTIKYTLQLYDLVYMESNWDIINSTISTISLNMTRKIRFFKKRKFRKKFLGRCLLKNIFEINYKTRSLIYISNLLNISLIKRKRRWIKKEKRLLTRYFNILNLKLIKKFWGFL